MWKNTDDSYGAVAIALHWLVAAAVIGLLIMGLWMVELKYYHPWYHRAPYIHKAVGILLCGVMLFRVGWRIANPRPRPEPTLSAFERRAAETMHIAFYVVIFVAIVSGYLIPTANGRPVEVFGLFSVPATLSGLERQADIAGAAHYALSLGLIAMTGLHTMGALKHHFWDRDRTLLRMLGVERRRDAAP